MEHFLDVRSLNRAIARRHARETLRSTLINLAIVIALCLFVFVNGIGFGSFLYLITHQ